MNAPPDVKVAPLTQISNGCAPSGGGPPVAFGGAELMLLVIAVIVVALPR
jgi:hypothetical protein